MLNGFLLAVTRDEEAASNHLLIGIQTYMTVLHKTSTPVILEEHGQSLEFGDFDSRLIRVCAHNANLVVTDDSVMLETTRIYGVVLRRAWRVGSRNQQQVGMNFVKGSSCYLHASMRTGPCKEATKQVESVVPGVVDVAKATEATCQHLSCLQQKRQA